MKIIIAVQNAFIYFIFHCKYILIRKKYYHFKTYLNDIASAPPRAVELVSFVRSEFQ